MRWCVYILEYSEGRLYTGITTDIDRRIAEHSGNDGDANGRVAKGKGAKALRGKGPLTLRYLQYVENRSIASKIESEIKKMSKSKKLALIAANVKS